MERVKNKDLVNPWNFDKYIKYKSIFANVFNKICNLTLCVMLTSSICNASH